MTLSAALPARSAFFSNNNPLRGSRQQRSPFAFSPLRASTLLDPAVAASEPQVHGGKQIKHDVSVPISRIAEYIAVTDAELQRAFPGMRIVNFGHLGDGNLRYDIAHPDGGDDDAFMARAGAVSRVQVSREQLTGSPRLGNVYLYKDIVYHYPASHPRRQCSAITRP